MDRSRYPDQSTHSHSTHSQPPHLQSAQYALPDGPSSRPYTGPSHAPSPSPSICPQRSHPMQLDNTQYSPDTCISSLLPPGVDPASVDFRTFYPYIPNEVKHRKRTSRAQLKVLEDIFRKDTKPNAVLRKKLAKQLDMTARGVQVWFQNRRAKEKTQAKKALTAGKTAPIPDLRNDGSSPKMESPPLSPELDSINELPTSRHSSLDNNVADDLNTSNPVASYVGQDRSNGWSNSSSRSPEDTTLSSSDGLQTNTRLLALRRGSLPTISQLADRSTLGPPLQDRPDLSRRRSVDTSLHRLASHPYAQVAMAKNGAIYGGAFQRYPSQSRIPASAANIYNNQSAQARTPVGARPSLAHRASLPGERGMPSPRYRASLDPRALRLSTPGLVLGTPCSPSPLPLASLQATRPDSNLFSIPARIVSSPIPGPLPSPNFSFGAPSPIASPSPTGTDGDSPVALSTLPSYLFTRRPEDQDGEDDGTSASYSRFGSIASLAGSESSNTSAYYSDIGSTGYELEMRRASCPSGQMMELMSGLDVNGHSSRVTHDTYSSQGDLSMCGMTCNTGRGNHCGSDSYPSPSSTVSPGHSPHVHEATPPRLPISRSSELAFALQTNDGKSSTSSSDILHHSTPDLPLADAAPNGFGDNVSSFVYNEVTHSEGPVYGLSAANCSSSSLGLPVIEYPDKYRYGGDPITYSTTGHYQPLPTYPPQGNGQYTVETSFAPGESHHGPGFGPSSEVYPTYNDDPCNVPSSIGDSLESIVQYS